MRCRVDVLAQDLPATEREDVDAVPFDRYAVGPGRGRGPLADREIFGGVEPAPPKPQRRPALEDAADVRANRSGAFCALARSVVLEDDRVVVKRTEAVEILVVPGVVVGVDQLTCVDLPILDLER